MDDLTSLQSLGLTLPAPAYLFGAIVFGLIGLAAFRFGRKRGRRRTLWLGIGLMVYPYAVSRTWLLYAVGTALCIGIALDRD
jgi:MFS family permease